MRLNLRMRQKQFVLADFIRPTQRYGAQWHLSDPTRQTTSYSHHPVQAAGRGGVASADAADFSERQMA